MTNSSPCGVLSRFRAGDTGLGYRRPNLVGRSYKTCPLCLANSATKTLNEVYVVLQCSSVPYEREVTGIFDFKSTYPNSRKHHLILKDYLGGDDAENNVLYCRASALNIFLNSWLGKIDHLF